MDLYCFTFRLSVNLFSTTIVVIPIPVKNASPWSFDCVCVTSERLHYPRGSGRWTQTEEEKKQKSYMYRCRHDLFSRGREEEEAKTNNFVLVNAREKVYESIWGIIYKLVKVLLQTRDILDSLLPSYPRWSKLFSEDYTTGVFNYPTFNRQGNETNLGVLFSQVSSWLVPWFVNTSNEAKHIGC